MTTIAWDGKTLASDSQVTMGSAILQEDVTKIFLLDGTYKGSTLRSVGFCGNVAEITLFKEWINAGGDSSKIPSDFSDICAIVLTSDKVYYFHGSINPITIKGKISIGSGSVYGNSAMSLGKDAVEAIEHAIKHDVYTSGSIRFLDNTNPSQVIKTYPPSKPVNVDIAIEAIDEQSNASTTW